MMLLKPRSRAPVKKVNQITKKQNQNPNFKSKKSNFRD
jgi:hypothetical protein